MVYNAFKTKSSNMRRGIENEKRDFHRVPHKFSCKHLLCRDPGPSNFALFIDQLLGLAGRGSN